ncbi:MAG: hypothetical protein JEY96_01480 [Bacteroidales bacterium]|nr:hypothetical protein [Bacteroidales bacterium]
MRKQQVKTESQEVISNLVYDSFNDSIWEMDGFFEILYDYFEGNPQKIAEELLDAIDTLLMLTQDDVFALSATTYSLTLLRLRKAFLGIAKDNSNV